MTPSIGSVSIDFVTKDRSHEDLSFSVDDVMFAVGTERFERRPHLVDYVVAMALPRPELGDNPNRGDRTIRSRRIARETLIRQVRVILERSRRLDEINPFPCVPPRELRSPFGGIERR